MAAVCVCGGTRASVYGRIRWGRTQVPQCESPGFGLYGGTLLLGAIAWPESQNTFHSFFFTPEQSADSSGHPSCLGESLLFFACFAFSKHSRLEDFTSRYQLFVESVYNDLYES